MMATAQKTVQDSQATIAASEQKMKDLAASMATLEKDKLVQQDLMTKTQTAAPMVKAALEQVKAALAVLPDNPDIKAASDGLAAAVDRSEKSIVAMTELIAGMDKQVAATKAESEAAAKLMADAKTAIVSSEESMKTVTAEIPQVETQVNAANAELSTAEQAVQAAAGIVETRRQQIRPQLQLSQAK
jgi:chromosome segregation ATPase